MTRILLRCCFVVIGMFHVSYAYGFYELPDSYMMQKECETLAAQARAYKPESLTKVAVLCEYRGTLSPDKWLTMIDPIARDIDWAIPCHNCLRLFLPERAPVPNGFKSYSLFLLPSSELEKDYELIKQLREDFYRFGDAIGNTKAAIWFGDRIGTGVDVLRSKYYCDKIGLNYNDGPYIVTVSKRPDQLTKGDEVSIIKLGQIAPSRIIRILNLLEQDLRMERNVRERALIYEEIKQRLLTLVERHGELLKDVVVKIIKIE